MADPIKALGNGADRVRRAQVQINPGQNVRPGPITFSVGVHPNKPKAVIFRVESTTGMAIHEIEGELAETVGQMLLDAGRQARSGLTIPTAVPPPDVKGP